MVARKGSGWGSTFLKLGDLTAVALEQGVGALEQALERTREGLQELDETHTARRHGRNHEVLDPVLASIAKDDWSGVGDVLRQMNEGELRRLRNFARQQREIMLDAGGPTATFRLAKMIEAERERQTAVREAAKQARRANRQPGLSARLPRLGRTPDELPASSQAGQKDGHVNPPEE